ncbi:hypothetical protein ABW19_dt0201465 [Dactylella cylindrospora]|nr:hypothetical protein ABW19_dt0201465 [Dactylella cylindrospora]
MSPDHRNHIFGVKRPVSTRVDLSHQEIELLLEIVTYASVIPETTPWNALFHAYDAILRKKGIDAARDDRCFRFLMRLAEIQGTSWYDRYATLLSMWHYEVPPKISYSTMNESASFSASYHPANLDRITITFKGNRRVVEPSNIPNPHPRIQPVEEDSEPKMIEYREEDDVRVNNGRSSPHPNALQRRRLPPSDEERRKREELEKMKAEFAFPTTMFETTSGVDSPRAEGMDTAFTRTSFLRQEDFEDQNDENQSPELTAFIPPIRDKAGLIAAAEKAVVRYNSRVVGFARDIVRHWRIRAYRAADYHQLQWDLACSKDQRVLLSQILGIWRDALYWRSLETRFILRRRRSVVLACLDVWREKAVIKAQRKEIINRNMLTRKFFRAWKAQAQNTNEKIRRFQLASHLRQWRERLAQKRAMALVAQQRYERDLKYRAYWTLFYGFCNIRAPQLNELRLKKFAVQLVRSRLASLKENETVADDFYCFSLLKRYFRTWHDDLRWTREIAIKADEERRYMLLYKGILTWRREARFAPIIRQHQENHDANQSTALIALWRNRLRQIKAADHVNKINVYKSMLKSWRLQLRKRHHEKYVKSVYLSTWFDKYSAALADRCYQYHVWKRWLGQWRGSLQSLRANDEIADDFAFSTIDLQLKSTAVQSLKARLTRVLDLEQKADEFRRKRLLASTFNALLDKHDKLRQMETWSASAAYFFHTKKTVKLWMQTMEKHKRQHRKDAYNQVVRNRILRIKIQAFNAMLSKQDSVVAMTVTAQDFFESGCKVQASSLLETWRDRLDVSRELQNRADDLRNTQLAATALRAWTKKLQSVEELYHLSETYNEISRRDKMAGILKKFNNAMFRRRLDFVKADMFQKRVDDNHKKSVLRVWRWACQEKVERRQIHDQFNREFVLEDERELEEANDQLTREQQFQRQRRSRPPSELGDRSILGPEGISMLDVSEWIKSNSINAPPMHSVGLSRIPQTPSARAARARALLEGRNSTVAATKLKLFSTTPASSPARKLFSKSIAPASFRRSGSGRPDLRFTQSLSSRLREEIKEVDEADPSIAFLDWDENENLPNVYEVDDEHMKASGSTTAVATLESPDR